MKGFGSANIRLIDIVYKISISFETMGILIEQFEGGFAQLILGC